MESFFEEVCNNGKAFNGKSLPILVCREELRKVLEKNIPEYYKERKEMIEKKELDEVPYPLPEHLARKVICEMVEFLYVEEIVNKKYESFKLEDLNGVRVYDLLECASALLEMIMKGEVCISIGDGKNENLL